MARELHGLELGLRIFGENLDAGPSVIFGSAAPGGDAGLQDSAELGSLYLRQNGASSSLYVKIATANAPADWEMFQSGGNVISGGYTPTNGTVTAGDTFEEAFQKLDANQQDIQTSLGIAQGAVDFGTFTGAILTDNSTAKVLFQELETFLQETDTNVDDLITLSGVAENSINLGTFTGVTIPDASTVKGALQSLETAHEEVDQNVNDLITLSGVAENATDLGTFTGSTISDNTDIKSALQELETAVETKDDEPDLSGSIAQNTPTTVDTVLVDDFQSVEWMIVVQDQGSLAVVKVEKLLALHNGNSGADATIVKDDVISKMSIGNVNLQASAVLSGTGASQTIGLQLETSDADGINYSVRRVNVVPAL